ncbi:putative sugar O-methyltransferase [Enhydrobacter aerosaccus]|uniref:Putative sugar O-methyltransferase n=1 Tax=Enhydrobacter aerosaccus TaxID=225324 RepID=A0A1T4TCH1_9HYPH|nr:putative sugar O-methyltransferase [Enhydrobacter aerosaccus]SKA37848.1 putative sugar O-methyltransferase [Enhydrobacter aerosaccus]
MLFGRLRRPPPPVEPAPPVWKAHTLRDNYSLSDEQYALCATLTNQVQDLYDQALPYSRSKGLDPQLVLPGNEWAEIVKTTGLEFRKDRAHLDYLRLHAPFAGYHLMFLDRLDVRHFAEPWNQEILDRFSREGMTPEIVGFLADRVDPAQRLAPFVEEYRQHLRNVDRRYIVRTPRLFGEIGLEIDGVLFNPDVTLCQSRINGLLSAGVIGKLERDIARRGRARVLEIGPGYGALAYALRSFFGPDLEYIAVDLPSSLLYSALYLSTLAGGQGCHILAPGSTLPGSFANLFLANYLFEEVADRLAPIDLALNTMSFTEMSPLQVRHYAETLRRLIGTDGVVFDENAAVRPHHTDSKAIFADVFPFRKHVESTTVTTKNWCQDVWANRYIGEVFDVSDHAAFHAAASGSD